MDFTPDEHGMLQQVRQAVSVLRDRNHETQVQLDKDAAVLDELVRLLDRVDDDRLARGLHAATVKAVRGQLHLINGDPA